MSILFTTVSRKHLRSRNHSLGEEFHFDFRVHGGESSLNGQTAYRLVPILFDRSTLSILHRVQISNLEKTKRKLDSPFLYTTNRNRRDTFTRSSKRMVRNSHATLPVARLVNDCERQLCVYNILVTPTGSR